MSDLKPMKCNCPAIGASGGFARVSRDEVDSGSSREDRERFMFLSCVGPVRVVCAPCSTEGRFKFLIAKRVPQAPAVF